MKLHPLNWKKLLDVDDNPCVSLYLGAGKDRQILVDQEIPAVRKLLERDVGKDAVQEILGPLERFVSLTPQEYPRKSEAFFASRSLRAHLQIDAEIETRSVVAENFHISPLFFSGWYKVPLLVDVDEEASTVFLLEKYQSRPVYTQGANISALQLYLKLRDYPGPITISGTERRRELVEHFLVDLEQRQSVEDLGQVSLNRALRKSRQRANLEGRPMRRIYNAIKRSLNPRSYDLGTEVKKLSYAKVQKLFIINEEPLWGPRSSMTSLARGAKSQRNAFDNMLVDNAIEIAIKRGIDVEYLPIQKSGKKRMPFLAYC